jgi:hypothetical protein
MLAVLQGASTDRRPTVEPILIAYESNRAALEQFGTLAFTYSDGVSDTVDFARHDLAKTRWRVMAVGRGRYLYKKPWRLFELLYPPEVMGEQRKQVNRNTWESPIGSWRAMTDGQTYLSNTVGVSEKPPWTYIHTAGLGSDRRPFFNSLSIPLALGDESPTDPVDMKRALSAVVGGDATAKLVSLDPDAVIDGVPVVVVRVELGWSRLTFWLDPERGSIPLRTRLESTEGEFVQQLDYSDIRRAPTGAWFPFRRIFVTPNLDRIPFRPGKGLRVFEHVITDANFETPPDRADFRIEFPDPVELLHVATDIAYPRTKVWDLDAISSSAARAGTIRAPLATTHQMGQGMPGERSDPWWDLPVIALGVLLAVGGGITLLRRRRRGLPT